MVRYHQPVEKNVRQLRSSRLVATLLVALALNMWLTTAHPLSNVPTANLDTGEVFRSVKAYRKEVSAHSIVFIGSSLVLVPMMQAEADFVGSPIPRMTHRRSLFIEHELSQKLDVAPRVFCMAIGGEMVSDAYLMVKNVLQGPCKPDAIVFGVAPRDIQDNTMPGIQSSESFRSLAGIEDVADVLHSASPTFESAADMLIAQMYPLWKYRSDLRTYYLLRTKKLMEACLPWVVFDKYGDTLELKPRRHGQFPEEAKGTPMIFPNLAMDHYTPEQTRFQYIKRYNPTAPDLVNKEFDYLDRLLTLCNQRGIKVLLVNMPLSQLNLSLMPQGFYEQYLDRLQQISAARGVELHDLCSTPHTANANFVDGVHLNTESSAKLLSEVCEQFARSSISDAFKSPLALAGRRTQGAH